MPAHFLIRPAVAGDPCPDAAGSEGAADVYVMALGKNKMPHLSNSNPFFLGTVKNNSIGSRIGFHFYAPENKKMV